MRIRALLTIGLLLAGGSQAAQAAGGNANAAFGQVGQAYIRALTAQDPVLATQLGGKGGGHAKLTEFGRMLVAHYRDIERESKEAFSDKIASLEEKLAAPEQAGAR